MGCCGGGDDELEDEKETKGPVTERYCTDVPCCILFVLYLTGFIVLYVVLNQNSDVRVIHHGKNDQSLFCGLDTLKDKPNIYYYDLGNDLKKEGLFGNLKGVCVEKCPATVGDTVRSSNNEAEFFVETPTSELKPFHRCVPRETTNVKDKVKLCGWPRCVERKAGEKITHPNQVCGPTIEDANKYWFTDKPDESQLALLKVDSLKEASDDEVEEYLKLYDEESQKKAKGGSWKAQCETKLDVVMGIQVAFDKDEKPEYQKIFEKYSGMVFQQASQLYDHSTIIAVVGIGGALVVSFTIILMYSTCVKVALVVLFFDLLIVMIAMDYIFFRKAQWNTGHSGNVLAKKVISWFGETSEELGFDLENAATHALRDEQNLAMVPVYRTLAVIWSILIVVVIAGVCFIQRQIRIIIALASEAATCLTKMPSLIFFQYIGVASLIAATWYCMKTLLAVMTLHQEFVVKAGKMVGIETSDPETFERVQQIICWLVVFGYLWLYFFHMAVFTAVIANCVSNWYFHRNDDTGEYSGAGSEGYFFGKPVLMALLSIARYDLGTLAFGSFLIAICTMPRLLLEYLDQELKASMGDNPLVEKLIRCFKCCLWCFEECIKAITEYAYINNAVTGKPFCRAAKASFSLVARYPVQVSLNTLVTGLLSVLSCVMVPLLMVVISSVLISEEGWLLSALFVLALAYVVTRITTGVYEVTLTTLFVCAMRDFEHFDGRCAPESLREAMGMSAKPPPDAAEGDGANAPRASIPVAEARAVELTQSQMRQSLVVAETVPTEN